MSCRASAKSLEACFPCVHGGKIRSQTDCREATNGLWSCSVARPPGACEERHKHLRYLSSGFGEHAQLSSLQHILRGAWSNQGEPPWNRGSAPGSLAGSCVEAKTWAGPPEATVLIAGILAATKTWRRRSFAVAQGARDVRKRDVPDHELVVVLTWEIRELWAQFLQSLVRQHDSPSFQARFLKGDCNLLIHMAEIESCLHSACLVPSSTTLSEIVSLPPIVQIGAARLYVPLSMCLSDVPLRQPPQNMPGCASNHPTSGMYAKS